MFPVDASCDQLFSFSAGAMIINGKLHRGRHGLGGEFGYMTTLAPAEKLNNWSQLASTGNMLRLLGKSCDRPSQSDQIFQLRIEPCSL